MDDEELLELVEMESANCYPSYKFPGDDFARLSIGSALRALEASTDTTQPECKSILDLMDCGRHLYSNIGAHVG